MLHKYALLLLFVCFTGIVFLTFNKNVSAQSPIPQGVCSGIANQGVAARIRGTNQLIAGVVISARRDGSQVSCLWGNTTVTSTGSCTTGADGLCEIKPLNCGSATGSTFIYSGSAADYDRCTDTRHLTVNNTDNSVAIVECDPPLAEPTRTPPPATYSLSGSVRSCTLAASGWTDAPLSQSTSISIDSSPVQSTNDSSYTFSGLAAGTYTLSAGSISGYSGPFTSCSSTSAFTTTSVSLQQSTVQDLYYKSNAAAVANCIDKDNQFVAPGATESCGCNGTKTCQSNGTWGTCSDSRASCPAPQPGTWDCEVWSSVGDRGAAGSACQADQYCVELGGTYRDPSNVIAWPVQQNWTFGSNLSSQRTFKSFPYNSTNSITMTATDNNGSGTSHSCTAKTVVAPPPGGSTTGSSSGVCNAPAPACGATTWGKYQGTNTDCSRTGQPCENDAQVRIRFFNEDCRTPYNQSGTLQLLRDNAEGDGHNDLFYGYNGTSPHWGGAGVCDTVEYHPYRDPGYQIKADGTLGACPPENVDSTPGDNDACLGAGSTPNEPSTWPRCFSPASSQHVAISSSHNTDSFGFSGTFDYLRGRRFAHSVGAPAGYQLKVNALCNSGYDGSCAAFFQGATNIGQTVKNFDGSIAANLTNYWASPFETINGSAFVLAYDVCVRAPAPSCRSNSWIATRTGASTYSDISLGIEPNGKTFTGTYYAIKRDSQGFTDWIPAAYADNRVHTGSVDFGNFSSPSDWNIKFRLTWSGGGELITDTSCPFPNQAQSWYEARGANVHANTDVRDPQIASGSYLLSEAATANIARNGMLTARSLLVPSDRIRYNGGSNNISASDYPIISFPAFDYEVLQTRAVAWDGNPSTTISHPSVVQYTPAGGALVLNRAPTISGARAGATVIVINGNLRIAPTGNTFNHSLSDSAGAVVYLVRGNITFAGNILSTDAVFIADTNSLGQGGIITAEYGTQTQPLAINGMLYAKKDIRLNRVRSSSAVSESTFYNPILLLLGDSLEGITSTTTRWEEVAPSSQSVGP